MNEDVEKETLEEVENAATQCEAWAVALCKQAMESPEMDEGTRLFAGRVWRALNAACVIRGSGLNDPIGLDVIRDAMECVRSFQELTETCG